MKLVLYSDEFFYKKLYQYYEIFDEDNVSVGSDFDRNFPDIIHVNDIRYINYVICNDGFQNVTDVIIQKSQIKNSQLLRILFKLKYFNPNINTILYLDDDAIYYEVLLSRIAKYGLCMVAMDLNELDLLLGNEYKQDLQQYILKKETKSLLKEFKQY